MAGQEAGVAGAQPEQIGTLTSIAAPLWWMIVAVLAAIALAILAWSVFGQVYVSVTGLGMTVPSQGQITTVPATGSGVVARLMVRQNQEVAAGTLLAEIAQPRLKAELEAAEASLASLQGQRQRLERQVGTYLSGRAATAAEQVAGLRDKIASMRTDVAFRAKVLADMEEEMRQGFVTRGQVEQARSDKISGELAIRDAQAQIQSLQGQLGEDQASAERQLFSLDQDIMKADQQVTDLTLALAMAQKVVSPIGGRVASLATAEGKMISAGSPVATMEPVGAGVLADTYFQIADGKRVAVGAHANVKIGSINSDVYGTAVGTVEFVADLASTTESLRNALENATVASQIERVGAPLKVMIRFEPVADQPGHVLMSSGRASPIPVSVGTTVSAQVVVEQAAPISYVIKLTD